MVFLVYSIISRPNAVTDENISADGSFPVFIAPAKPFNELAAIFKAN